MRRTLAVTGCLLATLAALPLTSAIAQDEAGLRIESVDVRDHPEVQLTVSVAGYLEGPVPADAFSVTEDGVPRDADVRYAESSDLQIVLLIDTTGSMGGAPIAGAKAAATSFIEELPDDVAVAVLGYDTEVTAVTDFSATRDEHLEGIDGLMASGRTGMYDAVITAVDTFPEADGDIGRAVVLLTDGEDNASESTVEEAIEALTAAEVTLHSVEYMTAFSDEAAIRTMAEATGGRVMEAGDAQALMLVYQELAATLISRYTIAYTSASAGQTEVSVTVDHDGLQATASRSIDLPALPPVTEDPADEEDEASVAPPVAPPPAVAPAPTGLAAGHLGLIAGAGLWFVALASLALVLLTPRARRAQVLRRAGGREMHRSGMSGLANRATLFAERRLERRGYRGRLNAALERAAINLRPGEFLVLVLSVAVTAAALGLLLHGPVVAALMAVITFLAAPAVVSVLTSRRQQRFAEQLGEILQLLSGSMRAGYSLMQAMDAVAREADAPASDEFGRLVVETRLGRDMTEALHAMADRVQCEDLNWVIQAMEIHREVGGDLAEVLDTVAGTIRERDQIRRQVRALSAEGRLSAYILLALPVGVGLVIFVTNRDYLAVLLEGGPLGWGLISTGVLLMAIGVIWIRKLVRLVF